jgi:hypothetical protein
MVLQAFVWIKYHVQLVLFTTKSTKDTKVSDDKDSELRALRVLRGENIFTGNPEAPSL